MFKYTYGYWDLTRNEVRNSPYLLFNLIAYTRSALDIQKRSDFLISQFKAELYDEPNGNSSA